MNGIYAKWLIASPAFVRFRDTCEPIHSHYWNVYDEVVTMHRPSNRVGSVGMTVGVVLLLGAASVQAQVIGTRVDTLATGFGTPSFGVPSTYCTNTGSGELTAGAAVACTGGVSQSASRFDASAEARAPSFNSVLPELGTYAQVQLERQAGPSQQGTAQAKASAQYTDYGRVIGSALSTLQMDFTLTGGFAANGNTSFYPSSAYSTFTARATPGDYLPDGAGGIYFASSGPAGSASFTRGYTALGNFFNTETATGTPGFNVTEIAPGAYRVSLSSAFFANSNNFQLRYSLESGAQIWSSWVGINSNGVTATSDFADTLRLTSVRAFDAGGQEVTGLAFGGFLGAPVPEPQTAALLLAGLLAVGLRATRATRG